MAPGARFSLTEHEAQEFLKRHGIPAVPEVFTRSAPLTERDDREMLTEIRCPWIYERMPLPFRPCRCRGATGSPS